MWRSDCPFPPGIPEGVEQLDSGHPQTLFFLLSQLPPHVTLEIRIFPCSSFTDPQGPDIEKELNKNGVEVTCF